VIQDGSSVISLLLHSDDIIIVSHDETIMTAAKAELIQAFEGTDNGKLSSFCGVEVRSSEGRISLSMEYYWNKLMTKFKVKEDEVENSPLKTKILRSECPEEPDEKMKTSYLQIIGSIIYGYTHCRLDLAFPVNMLTRIMHSPAEKHYNLLRKLLYYINGTKNWTLNYFKDATVFYGMDFFSSAMLTLPMQTTMRLTDQLEDGIFGYAKAKVQSLLSQAKPRTFLYLRQNQRLSGAAAQPCKALS
jgi:hypothetical protein